MSNKYIDLSALLSEPVETRLFHAHDKDCSPDILRVLSKDSFWFVRDYVALNLNTPRDCLEELMKDPDFRVRVDAERTLEKQTTMNNSEFSGFTEDLKLPLNERIAAATARSGTSGPCMTDHER